METATFKAYVKCAMRALDHLSACTDILIFTPDTITR